MGRERGVAVSSVLITEAWSGNVVGSDPHKRTVTTTVVDGRGGLLGTAHFNVSGDGHRAMEAWVSSFGPVIRWGVEGAASWGRHTAMFLANRGYDVRDVCPNRTNQRDRPRQRGKSDTLDSERIARETLAHPLLPLAFKRSSAGGAGPDPNHELLTLWNGERRSVLTSRQHLVNEAEFLLDALPEKARVRLPDSKPVRPRLKVAAKLRLAGWDAVTAVRLGLVRDHHRTGSSPLRATGGDGSHVAVEDAVSGQFADRITGFSKVRFERMRQGRHASQYFDPSRPEKTDDDARWALGLAEEVLSAARELLQSGRLDLY